MLRALAMLALATLAGCAPGSSADAGVVVHGCAEAIAAAARASCTPRCGVACDFTEPCCLTAGSELVCRDGVLEHEILGVDTGPCPDAGATGTVAHDCDRLATLCAPGTCDGTPCDFAGGCCVRGWEEGYCAGSAFSVIRSDAGLCAALDAGSVAHDCDQLRALCTTPSCDVACDFTGLCCLRFEQARCVAGRLSFVGIDVRVCSIDAGATDASTGD